MNLDIKLDPSIAEILRLLVRSVDRLTASVDELTRSVDLVSDSLDTVEMEVGELVEVDEAGGPPKN